MDHRVVEVWRLTWPKAIPAHEYETALMMAGLIATAGRKPEPASSVTVDVVPQSKPTGELISAKEAAELAGIHKITIYKWVRDGRLRRHGTGRAARYARADIERLGSGAAPSKALPAGNEYVSSKDAEPVVGLTQRQINKLVVAGVLESKVVEGQRLVSTASLMNYRAKREGRDG